MNGTNVKEKYSGNVFLNVEYVAFALCAKHEAALGCKIEHGITGAYGSNLCNWKSILLDK